MRQTPRTSRLLAVILNAFGVWLLVGLILNIIPVSPSLCLAVVSLFGLSLAVLLS